jgi:hypothetical protein
MAGLPMNDTTCVVGACRHSLAQCGLGDEPGARARVRLIIAVVRLAADSARAGVMWIGTEDGIAEFTAEDGCFEQVRCRGHVFFVVTKHSLHNVLCAWVSAGWGAPGLLQVFLGPALDAWQRHRRRRQHGAWSGG